MSEPLYDHIKDDELRVALGAAPAVLWHLDFGAKTLRFSPGIVDLLGLHKDGPALTLAGFWERIHPEDRATAALDAWPEDAEGDPYIADYRLRHMDGHYVWVAARGQWGNQTKTLAGSLENITARKVREQLMAEAKVRFDLAAKGALVGIWDWYNIQGDQQFWSDQFYRMLGLEPGTVTPCYQEISNRLHPGDVIKLDDMTRALAAGELEHIEAEYRLRHETQGYRWYFGSATAQHDEDGAVRRVVGTLVDIHDRVDAENKANQYRAELDLIFNAMPARIWLKDGDNTILRLNNAAARSMNVRVEDAEGVNSYDLFPDMAAKYHEDDLHVIRSKAPLLGVIEEYTPLDGPSGWTRTDKIPLSATEDGDPRLLVISTDITELIDAQDLIRTQALELERAQGELTQFAQALAEDLRQPLEVISGFCETLVHGQHGGNAGFGQDGENRVADTTRQLLSRLDGLHHYVAVSQAALVKAETDLNALVEAVKADLATDIADRDATLFAEPLPYAFVDHALFAHALQHIILNGLTYTQDGAPSVKIWCEHTEHWLRLHISDAGAGIDRAHAHSVFDLFARAPHHTLADGQGMGLAIARKIVTRHGGRLYVDYDCIGGLSGATLTIDLPLGTE